MNLTKKWSCYQEWLKQERMAETQDNLALFESQDVYETDTGEVYLECDLDLILDQYNRLTDTRDTQDIKTIYEKVVFA